ncbi:MAG: peptidylprolyl isomerase [Azonexus sp.]|nr:peptidylprolyl isomerase [Betaproteobacteria bacterium]MBK8917781.1 peptidylprolyl isomerase [Betaproteobacteria bacterium]MBP6035868.1 peptidylprolyl isomerase [Azonexus sp.]MBP6906314.1 peptidylprolyl isomerase [Azonexus sp.]
MSRSKLSPRILNALLAMALAGLPSLGLGAAEPSAAHAEGHSRIFAVVNGREVPSQEYENAFASLVRQKFYHGQVPEKEIAAAREEVRTRLVQRIVLLEEAARRGIVPDQRQVGETLAAYDTRYASSAAWRESREKLLPGLKQQLEEQSLVTQLESLVKKVDEPGDADVKAFFEARPELFTEPEKVRLSIIMLMVDPSSPATAWDATREEAKAIHKRLLGGADFSETARMHSGAYAESGGDMGYLHRGMLPEALQDRVDQYVLGQINDPVDTLEGVAILRVDDRITPQKREFADVAQRARELLLRDRQDQAWKALVQGLVAAADVKFFQGPAIDQNKEGAKP